MNNSGYIMVDMTGWKPGTQKEIPGIYKRLSDALETGKPIFISGIIDPGGNPIAPLTLIVYKDTSEKIHIYYEGSGHEVTPDDVISD